MNIAMISGRLVRDIELKYTNAQEPMAFCKFTLAVDRGMSKVKKEQAQQNGQAVADFINVTVFGKQAENCSKFLAKGRMVAIQGSLQSGSYTAQDGTKRYTTEVMAQRVEFIDWEIASKTIKLIKIHNHSDILKMILGLQKLTKIFLFRSKLCQM